MSPAVINFPEFDDGGFFLGAGGVYYVSIPETVCRQEVMAHTQIYKTGKRLGWGGG